MPAGRDEASANERDRRNLVQRRQLANRVEDDDVGARIGVHGQLRAADRANLRRGACCIDLGEPLLVARRDDEQRVRRGVFDRRKARSTALPRLASCCRRPRRCDVRDAEVAEHALTRPPLAGRGGQARASNLRLPVTVTHEGSAPMVDHAAGRLVALHAERVHAGQHAPGSGAKQAVPPNDRVETRPFTIAVLTPRRSHSRRIFGQISPSISTSNRGFARSSTRRTTHAKSIGK